MATYRGLDGQLLVDTVGGTPAAVGELVSWNLTTSATMIEDTAIGAATRTRKAGLKDWSASAELHFDPGDAKQDLLTDGASVDCVFLLRTTSPAEVVRWSGSAVVESLAIAVELDGIVAASVSLQRSGNLTRADT